MPTVGCLLALAAARLGWPLAETACVTLHGKPLARLVRYLAPGVRILALADDGGTPDGVAALLVSEGYGPSRMIVFEHMGGERERRIAAPANGWVAGRMADLNLVAIECDAAAPRARSTAPGLPDACFQHDGQLTKQPIRAATLAALGPLPGALLWDVGAGSGAIGIEWCRAAPRARAVAIERDPVRVQRIRVNADSLGVPELAIVAGSAPARWTRSEDARCGVRRRWHQHAGIDRPPAGRRSRPAAGWSPTR